MAPPGPIPNPEVKHDSAEGSVAIGYVRVGRRQVIRKSRSSNGPAFCVFSGKMFPACPVVENRRSMLPGEPRRSSFPPQGEAVFYRLATNIVNKDHGKISDQRRTAHSSSRACNLLPPACLHGYVRAVCRQVLRTSRSSNGPAFCVFSGEMFPACPAVENRRSLVSQDHHSHIAQGEVACLAWSPTEQIEMPIACQISFFIQKR